MERRERRDTAMESFMVADYGEISCALYHEISMRLDLRRGIHRWIFSRLLR
jgi:hypothetical protein